MDEIAGYVSSKLCLRKIQYFYKYLDKTNIVHFSLNVAKMMLEQEDD